MSSHLNNLPQQLTTFIGRENEIAAIKSLLAANRMVTLTGPAGCGKTRVALQLASELVQSHPHGVWLVELAMLSNSQLVLQSVASALTIREEPGRPIITSICESIRASQLLLVLDNCEHLIQECASVCHALLSASTGLRILATSREPLRIAGETTWQIPPMKLPDAPVVGEESPSFDALGRYEAVRLFIERARSICPTFKITEANACSIVEICRQLDGLPLAIELAAARVPVLAVEQIATRLSQRFRLLTSTSRSVPPRQRTLAALLDWSYDLLSNDERPLLRQLAVFSGTFTLEAVEAVYRSQAQMEGIEQADAFQLIDLLAHLIDKSLVMVDITTREARYRVLETIKRYAWGKLVEATEERATCHRHRDYYLALAEEAQAKLIGDGQIAWLDQLELEHDNMRAALDWTICHEENAELALCLTSALWRFWDLRGYISEGRRWLDDALAMGGFCNASATARAKALNAAGNLASEQNDLERAVALYEEALAIRREIGDKKGVARSLANLGVIARRREAYKKAAELYEASLAVFRELGSLVDMASVLDNLALVRQNQNDYRLAEELYSASASLFKKAGDMQGFSMAINNRGRMAEYLGNCKKAKSLYRQALTYAAEIGDKLGIVGVLNGLGSVSRKEGDCNQAVRLYRKSLVLSQQLGNKQDIANAFEGLALAVARQQPEFATQLLGAAEMLREQIGNAFVPHAGRQDHQTCLTSLRSRLGEQTFAAACAIGKTMSLGELLAALPDGITDAASGSVATLPLRLASRSFPAGLSKREVQVLRLVAAGLSDTEVAEELSLSTRTIHAHLRSIYGKLGVSSRGTATRFAIENNIA